MKCMINYQRDDDAAVREAQDTIDELAREYGRDNVIDFAGKAFDELEVTEEFDEFTIVYVIIGPKRLASFNYSHEPFDYLRLLIRGGIQRDVLVTPVVIETEDLRSIEQLFAAATNWSRHGGFSDWPAVEALQKTGSREVLTRALALTTAENPAKRALGLTILGRLGEPERTFPVECLAAIVRLSESDTDRQVLCSAAIALGHFEKFGGMTAIGRLAENSDPEVRCSVARSILGSTNREAIAVLIRLASDPVLKVRSWAMHALDISAYKGSAEARETLVAHLDHPETDLRDGAICGLARCRDPRVVSPLIMELRARPDEHNLAVAAFWFLGLPENADMPAVEELIKRLEGLR
jgi:HEAT repeat protein